MDNLAIPNVIRVGALLGLLALSVGATALGPSRAVAAASAPTRVVADLISETTSIRPGTTLWVALRLHPPAGWHTYWSNPGDSGLATGIDWALPAGLVAGPMAWPRPERLPIGPLVIYGYDGEAVLLTPIAVSAQLVAGQQVTLSAEASWVVCNETCIPEQASLKLTLPVSDSAAPISQSAKALFEKARAELPEISPWPVTSWRGDRTISVRLAGAGFDRIRISNASFFPAEDGVIDAGGSQSISVDAEGLTVTATRPEPSNGPLKRLRGVLEFNTADGADGTGDVRRAYAVDVAIAAAPSSAGSTTSVDIAEALLLALLGGLILNLMPCVLPVLAIKAFGFAQQATQDAAVARRHGLSFTAGVLFFFGVLGGLMVALRAAGATIGWGFQLQSPIVVAATAYILFTVGLNLSGVFELGTISIGGRLADRNGYAGSFFTGVLATLVASPCTAPFMGAALGLALAQPWYVALLIFQAVGLGMALPYLVLSFVPRLMRLLPRPGAWLGWFKQALAFPMYGACIWLVWVLAQQVGVDGLAWTLFGLLLIGFSAWLVGVGQTGGVRTRLVTGGLATATVITAIAMLAMVPAPDEGAVRQKTAALVWEKFSPAELDSVRAAGNPVMVDVTAAWCVSCLVNDATVLRSSEFAQSVKRNHLALLRGDWTKGDREITRYLESFKRAGVPLYVLYPSINAGGEPIVLPQILTKEGVVAAIERLRPAAAENPQQGEKR
jgi:thiol:disulfide interchange protein